VWNLLPGEDERMIAATVRDFLAAEQPLERLRPGAQPADAWPKMAGLGWPGAGLPEAAGGSAMGLVAEALIQRECGRYLVTPSMLATMLAGHVAWRAGDLALARDFATGQSRAVLVIDAEPEREIGERAVLAFDYDAATPLLYWNDRGAGLFAPDAASTLQAQACFDESLTLASGLLAANRPELWVPAETAPLAARAQVLLAAALTGLAEHACELAVNYASVREQFGKPIGSFQAVRHRCADMAVRQRLAWYQTSLACLKLEAGAADAALQVASAKLLAAEAAHENARACVQIHGGIGFQAECDAHWFLKRARVYDQAGGDMEKQMGTIVSAPSPGW
jgi:alkylation response protein AidB-like acyl-CoA dehydrogenase